MWINRIVSNVTWRSLCRRRKLPTRVNCIMATASLNWFKPKRRRKLLKVKLTEVVALNGEAWDEKRLDMLKKMNPNGRVAVTDANGQVFIAPIGNLEIVQDWKGEYEEVAQGFLELSEVSHFMRKGVIDYLDGEERLLRQTIYSLAFCFTCVNIFIFGICHATVAVPRCPWKGVALETLKRDECQQSYWRAIFSNCYRPVSI